ncbi:MAG: class V aminotransferase [Candidatus Cloacimonetes bacterium 4572_55]|nr:MAG: class V aminotransferase [Candidatus Cloacimonetes bacterium 4572_55]
MREPILLSDIRSQLLGLEEKAPLLDGSRRQYVNFDNGASTPTFKPVHDQVTRFLRWYANVHRGTGFKSQLASHIFEEARKITARFIKIDLENNTVLFTKNTTESINKLAHHFRFCTDEVVLTSMMEHHSNELPWRNCCCIEHIDVRGDGSIDMNDYKEKVEKYRGRLRLVAVTGASNVTGFVNPIHEMASLAHDVGAKILVDAAQLAPHRPIDVKPDNDPGHLDFVAFAAHKMYAPYGIGVLTGNKKFFLETDPDLVGGGTVDLVTLEQTYWTDLPDREEAGTPNIVGVVALGAVISMLERIGWDEVVAHEKRLTRYALEKFQKMPEVKVYGSADPNILDDRLGVISFNVKGLHHALVSAILNYEGGIGVRNGCFCAHPYLIRLLDVSDTEAAKVQGEILNRDRSHVPGAIRITFGIYNNEEEIDSLVEMLEKIIRNEYKGNYTLNPDSGAYSPEGFQVNFGDYWSF